MEIKPSEIDKVIIVTKDGKKKEMPFDFERETAESVENGYVVHTLTGKVKVTVDLN